MRRVDIAGGSASALGFGCASLGSRVSVAEGLRALLATHEAGVTWYDVAPAYGAGQAEGILGQFIAEVGRDNVQVCTKVGLAPPAQSAAKRLLRTVARPAVSVLKPLRAAIRKSGATANTRVPLTPDLVSGSLERSLTRLGADHVDVYALHNAGPEDLENAGVLRALEDLQSSGKTRAVAVAGEADIARAVLAQDAPIGVIQLAQPRDPKLLQDIHVSGRGCVTHSVFGVAGDLAALTRRLKADRRTQERLAKAGFAGAPAEVAASLLLSRAFASNPEGVVLTSMFSQTSQIQNIAAAAAPVATEAIDLFFEIGV